MHGEGALGTAGGMQALMDEHGALRVFGALAGGALGKALRRPGWFYRLAGPQARLVDDVTGTLPPYDNFVVVGPAHADDVCAAITAATGLPAAIVDANDLGKVDIVGATAGVPHELVRAALTANPAGNGDESTPVVIIRPTGADTQDGADGERRPPGRSSGAPMTTAACATSPEEGGGGTGGGVSGGEAAVCTTCGRRYPVLDGVLSFLTDVELPPLDRAEQQDRDQEATWYDSIWPEYIDRIELPAHTEALGHRGARSSTWAAGPGRITEYLAGTWAIRPSASTTASSRCVSSSVAVRGFPCWPCMPMGGHCPSETMPWPGRPRVSATSISGRPTDGRCWRSGAVLRPGDRWR